MAPPPPLYNATAVLENHDNLEFYASHLGPYLMGLCFQLFMMGILTLQTWNYYEQYTDDLPRHKLLVAFMFLSGTFMCATDSYMLYDSFVSGFGDLIRWDSVRSPLPSFPCLLLIHPPLVISTDGRSSQPNSFFQLCVKLNNCTL
jgi:hypothetical protein